MTKIYQVGGSVRDEILGQKSKDIDYAVEAESFETMRQMILDRGGKIFLETPQFSTIRANVPDLGSTDYVLCRRDGKYLDGRHPESVSVGTIYDDLARRDFTMNAIAKDVETGELVDPHNGIVDIHNKIIRCVGDPVVRFEEDKLRIFRLLRFAVCKGMSIEDDKLWESTYHAMFRFTKDNYGGFGNVSTERIREELLKMFSANTSESLRWFIKMPHLWEIVVERGIWLMPTLKKV